MLGLLVTVGWVALVVGVVLLVVGYLARPAAIRPGWVAVVIGVVLLVLGYVIPAAHTDYEVDAAPASFVL